MKRISLAMGGLVAAFFVAAISPYDASASHSWGGYHWARTSNPFTIKLGDNVTAAWDSYLNTAVSDWSASTVLDTTKTTGSTNPKTCRPKAGQVEVCNAKYGNNGWLGIAQVWITGGTHITQGTVKLNDSYFTTPTYNTPAWRNLVMCQEVGHTFGLAHQDENFSNANLGSCMDYTNDPGTNQHPNAHDYQMLEDIYAHTDSTTTVGSAAKTLPAPATGDLNSRAEWGKLVSQSANGKIATYERQLGNGLTLVTHVTYVPE